MAKEKKVEPYAFTPDFEAQVVYLCCARSRFLGRVEKSLEAAAMPSPAGQLAISAAAAIFEDLGHGPDDPLLVLQRLRRWSDDGKVTMAALQEVSDLFDAAEDAGIKPEEGVMAELAPVLKSRLLQDTVRTSMEEYSSKGDFSKVVSMVERAQRLGVVDNSLGTRVGGGSFGIIEAVKHLERLPTGVMELDAAIGNGMPRGQLGVLVGGPGDGKSMGLNHIAGFGWKAGLCVGYVSLELPEHIVLARLKANVTNHSIDSILEGNAEAKRLLEHTPMGLMMYKGFTPQATTVNDVIDWVKQVEDHEGRKMDLLIVDYADKLTVRLKSTGGKGAGKAPDNPYTTFELVYEGLRIHAADRKTWTWTASQSGRKSAKDKKRVTDLDDVSDSMGKVRVADLVITLNSRDDGASIEWYVAKNRTGKSRIKVGPLPVDFACGSMTIRPKTDTEQQSELLEPGAW